MGNSLLAVRDINHIYIVVERRGDGMKQLKKRVRVIADGTVERFLVQCESSSNYKCRTMCSPTYAAYAYGQTRWDQFHKVVDL